MIEGQVLEQIINGPKGANLVVEGFYDTVTESLLRFYDAALKYTVIEIPRLDLECPHHNAKMLLSSNWQAQPALDCEYCNGTRFVVPFDKLAQM